MKSFARTLLPAFLACSTLVGCMSPIEPSQVEEKDITVTFIYNLPTNNGNEMTKTSNAEVFDEFYEKITSTELVAETYDLELTETTTGAKYYFHGSWGSHDMVTLRTGTYHIVGSSTAPGNNIQQRCSFVFDEIQEISVSSSTISLTAQYDCFLLIFSANDISSLSNYNGEETADFFDFKSYKYAFVNTSLFKESNRQAAYIRGIYSDKAEFKSYTGNLNFEKGKYYVYSSVTGWVTAPQMEAGESESDGTIDNTAVDLGLSVKWRSMNLGAEKETDYGDRYAWGEITTKGPYTWANYKWCNGTSTSMNKYCTSSSYGTVDNKTHLDMSDDAARMLLGNGWRMPTVDEAKELYSQCTWEAETLNGVKGYRVSSKTNANSIFIPLNGQYDDNAIHYAGETMYLWLEQCNGQQKGYILSQSGVSTNNNRKDGLAIRPVLDN